MSNAENKPRVAFPIYHYLERSDKFKRILGHSFDLFKQHIEFLKKEYPPVSPNDFISYVEGKGELPQKCSVITFDDSLKEQATVIGPYLADQGISALFNISTSIFRDEPLNPQVIHFSMALYGVDGFVELVKKHFDATGLDWHDYDVLANPPTEAKQLHKAIKQFIKYDLSFDVERKLLLKIWREELLKDFPDMLSRVYMSSDDVKAIIAAGHEIGVHTDTHPVINDNTFTDDLFDKEIVRPKKELEKFTKAPIRYFSYPYASADEVVYNKEYLKKINDLGLDFLTVVFCQPDFNKKLNSNFIPRYQPLNFTTVEIMEKDIKEYEVEL